MCVCVVSIECDVQDVCSLSSIRDATLFRNGVKCEMGAELLKLRLPGGILCTEVWACVCHCCAGDSSVSSFSPQLCRNGLPVAELPPRCSLTACGCVCVCVRAFVFTCVGEWVKSVPAIMAVNRVSQLCFDITRLWLQLKMLTGKMTSRFHPLLVVLLLLLVQ